MIFSYAEKLYIYVYVGPMSTVGVAHRSLFHIWRFRTDFFTSD